MTTAVIFIPLKRIFTHLSVSQRFKPGESQFHNRYACLLISLLVPGLLIGINRLGSFQSLELAVYDHWVRSQSSTDIDDRLLIIGIGEDDIQNQVQWPLSDKLLAQLLAQLQQHEPAAIGLDLYRDKPYLPGTRDLEQQLQADNTIVITKLIDEDGKNSVPAPTSVAPEQIGFNDFVLDMDGVIRRYLMFAALGDEKFYSLSLRLSLRYLAEQDIEPTFKANAIELGDATFTRLKPDAGGYHHIDTAGYQILLQYRSPNHTARQLSLTDVLAGDFEPEWIRDKIVLIGTTAPSEQDLFQTPYTSSTDQQIFIPGVIMHAQLTSQILSAVLDDRPLFRFWPQGGELLWIWGWALAGGMITWRLNRPLALGIVGIGGLLGLTGITAILFGQAIWVPIVLPACTYLGTGIGVLAYKEYYRTFHDTTTGLPNRQWFMQSLQREITRTRQQRQTLAVLFLDLDRFKDINENFGHPVGDRLLRILATRLRQNLPRQAKLARLEGDEFIILLNQITDNQAVTTLADRLQEELSRPVIFNNHKLVTTVSTGIVLSTSEHEHLPEDWVRDAQTAMYRAKQQGKARHEIFAAGMRTQSSTRFLLEADLHQAIEQQQLRLHYQPLIDFSNGTIAGFEALVRWQHPERGLIYPNDFIPLAEENGLIIPIGYWVLQEACRQTHHWHQQFPHLSDLFINVNLSGRQFVASDLVDQVAAILRKTSCSKHALKLELTESVVMDNVESTIEVLVRLRALDVQIGIDDFGTGYSSLSYLHRFPINTLKVDRSFVMRMEEACENAEIVKTIIALGHNLNMKVVAEGVETESQAQKLRDLDCEYGQGYFFAKPLPPDAAEALLRDTPQYLTPASIL
ncbi:MAG: EAL domain-containing protein [Cyanobacteria bacterium P01_D01_bin.44]